MVTSVIEAATLSVVRPSTPQIVQNIDNMNAGVCLEEFYFFK